MPKKRITEAVTSMDVKSKRWRSLFAAGRMAYESGEFRQAESLLARAFELAKDMPERTFATNATEIGMAAIWLAEKRPREAESRLRENIAALESYPDHQHKELLAVALRFLAQALADKGDEREAESELKRSAAILKELGSDASVQLAYTLCDLCGLYITQGRISEASPLVLKAMKILSEVNGPDSAAYMRADMIFALCAPLQADSFMDQAAEGIMRMEYFHGTKHPNMERALGRYLKALTERGDTARLEEAKQQFGVNLAAKK